MAKIVKIQFGGREKTRPPKIYWWPSFHFGGHVKHFRQNLNFTWPSIWKLGHQQNLQYFNKKNGTNYAFSIIFSAKKQKNSLKFQKFYSAWGLVANLIFRYSKKCMRPVHTVTYAKRMGKAMCGGWRWASTERLTRPVSTFETRKKSSEWRFIESERHGDTTEYGSSPFENCGKLEHQATVLNIWIDRQTPVAKVMRVNCEKIYVALTTRRHGGSTHFSAAIWIKNRISESAKSWKHRRIHDLMRMLVFAINSPMAKLA